MKIAILSDIHEGLNRKNTGMDIMSHLIKWIKVNSPEVFIISGDITAGPRKSLDLLNHLQEEFPMMKLLFVHGNHDIYHEDSKSAYDMLLEFPGNLGNGPVELNDSWVVIGDGGWYDYTFGIRAIQTNSFQLEHLMILPGLIKQVHIGKVLTNVKRNSTLKNLKAG